MCITSLRGKHRSNNIESCLVAYFVYIAHVVSCVTNIQVPTLVVFFYRLVHLELNTYAQSWWDLLTQMLENSPKLASLKLTNVSG